MNTFKDKVALITGGTTGIGRATAVAFGREGAKVVVAGRREKEGLETVQLVKKAGGEAIFVRADVSKAADVKRMVAESVKAFGRLDCVFNNAGIESRTVGPIVEHSEQEYDEVMDINVKGVFLTMQHAIPALLASGGGAIVNTSSVAGVVAFAGVSPYTASKHAVVGLTKCVALEYATQGIRVNAVAPAAIDTPMVERFTEKVPKDKLAAMHPIGRMGKPEEIAECVLWLCSPAASFVTGQTIAIDGGWTAQ